MSGAELAVIIPAAVGAIGSMQQQQQRSQAQSAADLQSAHAQGGRIPVAQAPQTADLIAASMLGSKPVRESWPQNISPEEWMAMLQQLQRSTATFR